MDKAGEIGVVLDGVKSVYNIPINKMETIVPTTAPTAPAPTVPIIGKVNVPANAKRAVEEVLERYLKEVLVNR